MEKKNKKKLIVVLGMHRSGTSTVTRGLSVLGVDLGNDFLPDNGDNPKGFWEDSDLNKLNIEMLNAIGNQWHYLAQISRNDVDTLHKKGYFLRATELLQTKTQKRAVFGFKDPRITKLLIFWQDVFAHSQLDVGYVLAIRHPLSVVKSLARRNGFDHEKSYFMWLEHVINSLSNFENCKRVLVDYDLLIQSPDRELNRIAKNLDLSVDQSELKKYATEFLDNSLRHTTYSVNDLSLDATCPPLVHEIYATLFNVATGETSLDETLQNKVPQWDAELKRLKVPLVFIDNLYKQRESLIKERDDSIKDLQDKDREKELIIQMLRSQLEEKSLILESTTREQDAAIKSLQNQIIEKDQRIQNSTDFEKLISEKEQKITLLQLQLTEQNADIKKLIAWMYDTENIVTALLTSRRWKIGNMIGNLLQRITRKPEGLVTKHLAEISDQVKSLEQKYQNHWI